MLRPEIVYELKVLGHTRKSLETILQMDSSRKTKILLNISSFNFHLIPHVFIDIDKVHHRYIVS